MSKLKVKLLKEKPHKLYSANVTLDYHVRELCDFLYGHQDRVLEIIINGKKIKFNSIVSRKKFAQGFKEAGRIIFEHTKQFASESQGTINSLTNEITQLNKEKVKLKEELYELRGRVSTHNTVSKLRTLAWQDSEKEWRETCEVIKDRLDKVEPIIRMLRNAKSDGDLNKVVLRVKKHKL